MRSIRRLAVLAAAFSVAGLLAACENPDVSPGSWHPVKSLNRSLPNGVTVLAYEDPDKPIRAWAVLIDEQRRYIETRIEVSTEADRTETADAFATRLDACVVVNGGYFAMNRVPAVHAGLLVLDGAIFASATRSVRRDSLQYPTIRAAFGLTESGEPDIAWVATENDTLWAHSTPVGNTPGHPADNISERFPWRVRDAVGGGPALVSEGRPWVTTDDEVFFGSSIPEVHPRTAVGYRSDGTLILLVVDGRQQQSRGASLEELALLMTQLEAIEAMNLDGGGSSTLIVDGILINRPSGGTFQREIMSAIAVYCNE